MREAIQFPSHTSLADATSIWRWIVRLSLSVLFLSVLCTDTEPISVQPCEESVSELKPVYMVAGDLMR